jgi:hypothetical protein
VSQFDGHETFYPNYLLSIAHDFFEAQPIKDATVFLTRYTTHNWSDKYATKFLARLRDAARPDTKLIVMDDIQDYACRASGPDDEVPGAAQATAPEPLLPHPGASASWSYGMDLAVRPSLFVHGVDLTE